MKKKLLNWFTFLFILAYLLGRLGYFHWFFDVFSHFQAQYLLGFLLLIVSSVFLKERILLGLNSIFLIICIIPVSKFYIGNKKIQNQKADVKICAFNLLSSNSDYQSVIDYMTEETPDIILFQELNQKWETELKPLNQFYPYQWMVARPDNFGIGILSKIPMDNQAAEILSRADVPTLVTDFIINENQVFTFIGTHPVPPLIKGFQHRNEQLNHLNELVKSVSNPIVLMGDLNCTSYSPNFKRLISGTSLKDARLGFGLQPTWHADFPIRICIDHCLVSDDIQVVNKSVGGNLGSDHLPISVEIKFK